MSSGSIDKDLEVSAELCCVTAQALMWRSISLMCSVTEGAYLLTIQRSDQTQTVTVIAAAYSTFPIYWRFTAYGTSVLIGYEKQRGKGPSFSTLFLVRNPNKNLKAKT